MNNKIILNKNTLEHLRDLSSYNRNFYKIKNDGFLKETTILEVCNEDCNFLNII